jgi:hypothetical protein
MTAAYGSSNVAGVGTGVAAVTVTKPTSLAEGDLLTAVCLCNNGAALWAHTSGGGGSWTDVSGSPEAIVGCATLTKIADASDVSATNFTFTRSVNTAGAAGVALVRTTAADIAAAVNHTSGTGTTLTLAQVTAANADTLLLHVVLKVTTTAGAFDAPPGSAVSRATGTASGTALTYAIADEVVGSGATGTRAWTYTGSSASRGVLLAINPGGATVQGQATAAFGFTATAAGVPETFGAAAADLGFSATASGVPRTSGQAAASFGFTATAAGVDRALGAASAPFEFTGTAVGVDRAIGAAAAAFGFTGTATGVDRPLGVAAAALGFTATASGEVAAPPVVGQATAAFGFAATALGVPETFGVAVAPFGFTGTATGAPRKVGVALATFGFTGTAAGSPRHLGVAVASFGFSGSASGTPRVHAVALALFGFTATADGVAGSPPVEGQATAAFGFTATAAGVDRTLGVAVVSFGFTGSAAGVDRALGQVTADFGFTATATGIDRALGQAQAAFGFTATISISRDITVTAELAPARYAAAIASPLRDAVLVGATRTAELAEPDVAADLVPARHLALMETT